MPRVHSDHDLNIYAARVYLREAAARRSSPSFHAALLTWAANARRRASQVEAAQADLFAPLSAPQRHEGRS